MKAGTTDLFAIRTPKPKRQKKSEKFDAVWSLGRVSLGVRGVVSFTIEFRSFQIRTKNSTFAEF